MARKLSSRGFTIIELMVTVAIMAIGMAIAYPSFTGMIRSNRLATSTNTLISPFNLARTEAIRSNRGGGICMSANGTSCTTSGGWEQGWLVWTDLDGKGDLTAGEPVVRYFEANSGLTMTSDAEAIIFDQRGRLVPRTDIVLTLKSSECPKNEKLMREITVSQVGQVRFTSKVCP